MSKKLGGVTFIRRGVDLGYCFEEAIRSLQAACDVVYVVYCESEDATLEKIKDVCDGKTYILICIEAMWQQQVGKDKLSFFQNVGIEQAQADGCDYVLIVQGDECLHEDSIPYIRRAMALGEEGYYVSRHNLWGSTQTMLNVAQNRKPVSSVVNRLTKSCYRSVGDGESQASDGASLDFINKIDLFHAGFVRDRRKHVKKIEEIQGNIFCMDVDDRVKGKEEFDEWNMGFSPEDVIAIEKPLPIYLQSWAEKTDKANGIEPEKIKMTMPLNTNVINY